MNFIEIFDLTLLKGEIMSTPVYSNLFNLSNGFQYVAYSSLPKLKPRRRLLIMTH